MAPQQSVLLVTSILNQVVPATTTRTSSTFTAGLYEASEKVSFPPIEFLEEVENLPALFDDEDNISGGFANAHARVRRDSTSSVTTIRGREHSKSLRDERKAKRPSKRQAPPARSNRPFKRCRTQRFSGDTEAEADLSERVDESKFNSFLTDEGIFQLNPTTPSLIGNHTSTVELAELIDLIADEAEAAKALDNESAVVVAGLLAPQPFEVSVKFAKQHIVVWDVDLEATYAIEGVIYVKDARPFVPGQLLDDPVQSLAVEWQTSIPSRKGQGTVVVYETSLDERETVVLYRHEVVQQLDPAGGIHAAERWEWVPAGVPGTCRGGGWAMRVWIPVPMSILEGRTGPVASVVRANVRLADDDTKDSVAATAEAVVTMEHLKHDRDIDVPVLAHL